MADEKDRLGDKLRQKQKGEEDRFFKEQDQKAIERLRQAQRDADEQRTRELARGRCPRCGDTLQALDRQGVALDECPAGHGLWLDHGELEQLAERERDSWIGRWFYRPKRVL
jgi:hypothetical protein